MISKEQKQNRNKEFTSGSARGQSMVEFAISFTFLMFLLAGAIDLGRAYFSFIALRDAAQEGALYGSLFPGDESDIRLHIRTSSVDPVDLSDSTAVTINIAYDPGDLCSNAVNSIIVTVRLDFEFIMPLLGVLIPSQQVPLYASMTNTILRPAC